LVEAIEGLVGPKSRVGAQQLGAGRAGPLEAGDQFIAEAQHPPGGVRRPCSEPDVQALSGVGARRDDRVIAAQAGVAKRGALLGMAVHLTDQRIDVNDETVLAGTRARLPRTGERLAQDAIKLPDVPNVNARRNVPSVEGAITSCPRT
jgi:hypothetical protein